MFSPTKERGRDKFEAIRGYVFANPVRAGLVESWRDWAYSGSLVVGYPDLYPRENDFHERFWRIYYRLLEEE